MSSLYDRLMGDLQTLIQALDLVGVAGVVGDIGTSVYLATRETKQFLVKTMPRVLVTNQGLTEEELPPTFTNNFTKFPVLIAIQDQTLVNPESAGPTYRLWRQQIQIMLEGLCRQPILANSSEVYDVRIGYAPSLPAELPDREKTVGSLMAYCKATRQRVFNR